MSLLEQFSLKNQVAIITGAGRGIGRAIAMAYAEAGAHVVCASRTQAEVDVVAAQVPMIRSRPVAASLTVFIISM